MLEKSEKGNQESRETANIGHTRRRQTEQNKNKNKKKPQHRKQKHEQYGPQQKLGVNPCALEGFNSCFL
jgi:hypothetical protein